MHKSRGTGVQEGPLKCYILGPQNAEIQPCVQCLIHINNHSLTFLHVVSSFSWCCYFIVMEFACPFSLVDSILSILPTHLLRHSWHFRGFVLLRLYLLRVGFGCITFPTVTLVSRYMLMFDVFEQFCIGVSLFPSVCEY